MVDICLPQSAQYGTALQATQVTGSVYARRCRPSPMFLAPNTWPSVAVHSVQLQLMRGTVYQRQCSLLSHWTFFDAAWKLNCSFERSYNWHCACQTTLLLRDSLSLSRSFLLCLQPWSLSTIMLLWHSFLIIIICKCICELSCSQTDRRTDRQTNSKDHITPPLQSN